MLFGLCCEREGLFKFLYVVHIFILAGVLYYYLQKSVGKIAPEMVGQSSQPMGKTLRPVWGMMMDKCYSETTQRHRVKSEKQQASGARSPRTTGRQNDSVPKEETDISPQGEGQEKKKDHQEVMEYSLGASVMESKEERLLGWVPQLLRKFWPSWFLASDTPKMQSHE
ncbi:uncharacterized protein LOC111812983 [Octodon degus]|uniref:Uncharacterized protein LOC111812983 n=1 Tax=Octodon degus TaxID=10160 RepID=A0A6P6DEM3_OCTDE|nr:uncharacterized protein LOC111812983 [Octodon degus]